MSTKFDLYDLNELKTQFANYMFWCSVSDTDEDIGAAARYITNFVNYLETMIREETKNET